MSLALDSSLLLDPLLARAEQLWRHAGGDAALWPQQRARWLAQAWSQWLNQQADLSADARRALQLSTDLLLADAAAGHEPWANPDRPLRALIEHAAGLLRGFDARSGRRAEALPQRVHELLANAVQLRDLSGAAAGLSALARELAAEIRPVEQQLVQKDREQRRREDAARHTARLLDEHIGIRPLPAFARRYFDGELRKLMQILHVQGETRAADLAQLTSALDHLLWALTEADADSLKREYAARVAQPQATLLELMAGVQDSARPGELFFAALEEHLFAIISGHKPADDDTWLPQGEAEAGSWTLASDASLRARALRVGDWLELATDAGPVRARLLDKDLHRGIYLFANLSGLRVARYSQTEMVERLEQGQARIVDSRPLFIACQGALVEAIENRILRLQEEALARAEAAKQAEAERLRAELAKAQAHLAAERARRQAELKARAEAEARARLIDDCKRECAKLQSGAWIAVLQNGGWLRAQLAVVLARSGERLFVDDGGRKVLQADLDQLATLLADQQLRISDHGKALDETLRQMVQDRRQHLEQQSRP